MPAPTDVTSLLQQLIRIPSVNPAGEPGTPHTGEQAIAEWLADFTRSFGGEPSLEPVQPNRPNLLVRFPGGAGKPRVVLAPHLDTVSVGGMSIDPFGGDIHDGRIYGRGASDTKGSIAAMLWALHELQGQWEALPFEIWFAGLMGEEAGNDGARALAPMLRADWVIAGEPTLCQVVHRHKGACWLELETLGIAGHGSNPRPGENAILRMATLLPQLQAVADRWAADADPDLGSSTLNIGVMQGGTKVNIVPSRCRAELDLRVIDLSNRWQRELEEVIATHAPHTTLTASRTLPPLNTPRDHPMVQQLLASGSKLITAPWFCDAAIFSAAGIPSVALGPGSIAQAHTADEWIAIEELERGAKFFQTFLSGQHPGAV